MKNLLLKWVLLFLTLLGMEISVSAQVQCITDVMLIGGSESEVKAMKSSYASQGWMVIDQDLNKSAGGSYIYLLYKTGSASDAITDFYLRIVDNSDHPETLTHNGRTYHLTPGGGNDDFNRACCDLNHKAHGKDIYLYYTKDGFPDNRLVTEIYFNKTSYGAVGENGGTTGCDLNEDAGGDDIFMHFYTIKPGSQTRFITDVMLIGGSKSSEANSLKSSYESQGWTVIDQDLNRSAGGYYIFLLYKTGNESDAITDFYLKVADSSDHPETLSHNGRTYHLTPGGGNDEFNRVRCDLNYKAKGKYIYLYYTKDAFPGNGLVSDIVFNETKNGAVGENGGFTGCDLNKGAGGDDIFMHVYLTNFNYPHALWCEGNHTLYFTNTQTPYAAGDKYQGHTVTNVWMGNTVVNTGWGTPNWDNAAVTDACTKAVFDESFANIRPTSIYKWFYNMSNLAEIEGLQYLNTSEVTNMNSTFAHCQSLTTIDLSGFDATKVSNCNNMFNGCSLLTTIYSNDIWDPGISSGNMFGGCSNLVGAVSYDHNKTEGDMANPVTGYFTALWEVNFSDLAYGVFTSDKADAYTNTSVTLTLVSEYDGVYMPTVTGERTGSSIDLTDNGDGTYSFTMPAENVSIGRKAIPHVPYALWCAGNNTLYFNSTLRYRPFVEGDTYDGETVTAVWSGDNVVDMGYGTPGWDNEAVTAACTRVVFDESFANVRPKSLRYWFSKMEKLTEIEGIQYLNTSEVTNMDGTFQNCKSLETLDLNGFDVSKVSFFSKMFLGCSSLTTIYSDNAWDVNANATSEQMFSRCDLLVGAVGYDSNKTGNEMANPDTGYFTGKWTVTVIETAAGVVSADKDETYTNETVTLTLVSASDHGVYTPSATCCRTGNAIDLTDNGDGTFTFTMPADSVAIGFFNTPPYVVWCAGNNTLYFTNSETPLSVGDTFDGQTVTDLWNGIGVTNTGTEYPGWQNRSIYMNCTKVVLDESFAQVRPHSLCRWFYRMNILKEIEGLQYLNTSEVTNVNYAFASCPSLTTLDVNGFDVGKISDFSTMFFGCNALSTIYCNNTWSGISNVLFFGCDNLVGAVSYDGTKTGIEMANPITGYFTGKWTVNLSDAASDVVISDKAEAYTNVSVTLTLASASNYGVYMPFVTGDRTGNAIDLADNGDGTYTFTMPAESVTIGTKTPYALYSRDDNTLYFINSETPYSIGSYYDGKRVNDVWSGTQVVNTGKEKPRWNFYDCTRVVFDESFAEVRPHSLHQWFSWMARLQEIVGLQYLNTSEVTDMCETFQDCTSLETLDLTGFDVGKVNDFSSMFSDCSSLTTIYCNDTWEQPLSFSGGMFFGCARLVGAVSFDSGDVWISMANPVTGYFTSLTTLADDSDNTTLLNERYQYYGDVTLSGRTLRRDGTWNTLCLPFSLTETQLAREDCPLHGATIKTLESSTFDKKTNSLTLNFNDANSIAAGTPYIVRWATDGDDFIDPVFKGVTFITKSPTTVASSDGTVNYTGTYAPYASDGENMSLLYLGNDNKLYHPKAEMAINAFRAFFQLYDGFKGDVNGDGIISVIDVTLLVDFILGHQDEGFIVENADVDGNGNISVTDVTGLVDAILSGNGEELSVVTNLDGVTISYGGGGSGPAKVGGAPLVEE